MEEKKKSIKKISTKPERAHRDDLWIGKTLCCKLVKGKRL